MMLENEEMNTSAAEMRGKQTCHDEPRHHPSTHFLLSFSSHFCLKLRLFFSTPLSLSLSLSLFVYLLHYSQIEVLFATGVQAKIFCIQSI